MNEEGYAGTPEGVRQYMDDAPEDNLRAMAIEIFCHEDFEVPTEEQVMNLDLEELKNRLEPYFLDQEHMDVNNLYHRQCVAGWMCDDDPEW